MSTMSLNIRASKAPSKDEKLLENTSLSRLAKSEFRLATPPQYSRKEPREPLLRATPSDEKDTVVRQWRVMMKFTGDMVDYRQGMTSSCQPNLGCVMGRLYKEMNILTEEEHEETVQDSMVDGMNLKTLPNKPHGGTLQRLRKTLTLRLFKNKTQTIFHTLPMEDTLMTPLDQAHYIIGLALLKPLLRDELYCQVCKQLVKNPYKTSSSRLWLLLALVISCFPPSHQISGTIESFIEEAPALYSKSLLRLFKSSMKNGVRHQPPSFLELESYMDKKPIELQITLMDGTVQTIVADGTSTAKDVCTKLCDGVGLRQKFGYSLYISMFNKVASLGSGCDRVMDSVSQCEQLFRDQHDGEGHAPWKLFFRKELFSPWDDTFGDMIAISLAFAQIVRGIMLGEYIVDSDQELAMLAAKQYYTEYGDEISGDSLQALLPSYIPANRRLQDGSLRMWRRMVIKAHHRLFILLDEHKRPTIEKVKHDVISYAKTKWGMSFSRYYEVVELEGPQWGETLVTLAVNSTGVYVLSSEKRMLQEISFLDIVTIRGESSSKGSSGVDKDNIILFVLTDGSFIKFESLDATDIRDLVDHIVQGLRIRSKWAVIREDIHESTTESIDLIEGDLIELDLAAGKAALSYGQCIGTNARTSETGLIPSHILYVLPVLDRPTEDMMRPFRTKKRRGPISSYLNDAALITHDEEDEDADVDINPASNGLPEDVPHNGLPEDTLRNGLPEDTLHNGLPANTLNNGLPEDTLHNGYFVQDNIGHVTESGHVNGHVIVADVMAETNGGVVTHDIQPTLENGETAGLEVVDEKHEVLPSSANESTIISFIDERKTNSQVDISPHGIDQDGLSFDKNMDAEANSVRADTDIDERHCMDSLMELVDRVMPRSPDTTSDTISDLTDFSPVHSPDITCGSDLMSPLSSPPVAALEARRFSDSPETPPVRLTSARITEQYGSPKVVQSMSLSIAQEDMECHL